MTGVHHHIRLRNLFSIVSNEMNKKKIFPFWLVKFLWKKRDLFILFLLISFLWTFIYAPLQKEYIINSNHNNFQLF